MHDREGGAVVAVGDEAPMPGTRRTDGEPAGVVDKGVGDEPGGAGVLVVRDLADSILARTYVRLVHWRRQGDLGELSAMEWFASKGASICVPVGHAPDWDFIAVLGERLLRVQVKTCTCFVKGRWQTRLCTSGGNQSWNGIVKRFEANQCDYLFVVVADGRQWCIPSSAIAAGRQMLLGGPKYGEFEVEAGRPLPPSTGGEPASTIAL
jgi:PD-(D/E)XK endonuclease